MVSTLFIATAITALVMLAYAVKQLGTTFTDEYDKRKAENDFIDELNS